MKFIKSNGGQTTYIEDAIAIESGGTLYFWGTDDPSSEIPLLNLNTSALYLKRDGTQYIWDGAQWNVTGGASSELPAITSVNSIPAVGNGIPVIVAQANLRAQSTGLDVLDYTPTTTGKTYRVDFSGYVTTTRVNSVTLSYTDQNGASVSIDMPVLESSGGYRAFPPAATNWGTSDIRFFGQSFIFSATTATHIKLTTSISGGSCNYDIDAILIRLN